MFPTLCPPGKQKLEMVFGFLNCNVKYIYYIYILDTQVNTYVYTNNSIYSNNYNNTNTHLIKVVSST